MHTLFGVCLFILHGIGRYRLLGASLHRWLLIVLLVAALFTRLGWLPGGLTATVALLLVAALLVLVQTWARRRFYVHFTPAEASAPAPAALPPAEKTATLAAGFFGVDERTTAFTNLSAFYRTYATGEHAILARNTPTRCLGLGEADPTLLGMWYIFVTPAALKGVRAGVIWFGRSQRPGLRIEYVGRNKKDQPVGAVAYLSFEGEDERNRVWADLLV